MLNQKHNRRLYFILSLLLMMVFSAKTPAHADSLSNPKITSTGAVVWDLVSFGTYYQSGSTTREPIQWRVLQVSGNDAFLLANDGIFPKKWHDNYEKATWETCTIRTWLNNEFMTEAFTPAEQAAIRTVSLSTEGNPAYYTGGGADTQDKVFLLSITEATTKAYGFPSVKYGEDYRSSSSRSMLVTDYAVMNRAYRAQHAVGGPYTHAGHWWLRSPGNDGTYAAYVNESGEVVMYGASATNKTLCIRPAFHVNLSVYSLKKTGTVQSGDNVFEPTGQNASSGQGSGGNTANSKDNADSQKNGAGKEDDKIAKNEPAAVNGIMYKLSGSAAVLSSPANKKASKITVPATVRINGKSVPVTSIAPNAFKGMKNLTSVTIGKNIKKIGKNAFSGCKKLKKIMIKTTKLTAKTVGANAFKGISKKAVIKCPKSKKSAYKKFLLKKGMKKTMIFK